LSATESLSDLVKEIKRSTNIWIKQSGKFPSFSSWAHEYGAFSCSYSAKEIVRQYIIHQQEHHKKVSFEEELEKIIEECGMERYEHKDET
jgi:putative transposase